MSQFDNNTVQNTLQSTPLEPCILGVPHLQFLSSNLFYSLWKGPPLILALSLERAL